MMSCKEIVRVLSSGDDRSLMKRAELRMHLLICKYCKRYARQLKMIKAGIRKLLKQKSRVDEAEVQKMEALAIALIRKDL